MGIRAVSLGCLLFHCLLLLSEGHETRLPLRSAKAPAETIMDYNVVTPAVTYRSSQEEYPAQLHILIITGEGSSITLQLQQNDYVLSAGFTSRHYTPDGAVVEEEGHDSCFYQGHVLEHPGWSATMSTCHGLRGSFGDPKNREKFFHVEPLSQENVSLEQQHALYLDTELKQRAGQCGTASHSGVKDISPSLEGFQSATLRQQISGFYILEWTVYNDNSQYLAYGSNINKAKLRALEVANQVDNIYRVLRIRIALVTVVTWSSGDPITTSTDPYMLITAFQSYLGKQVALTDSTMLFTGMDLNGNTVGRASLGTMCSGSRSSGISQDGGRSLDGVAATASHELGHIFGMTHDDRASCNCVAGLSKCIMASVSKSNQQPTMWSQCSRYELNKGFQSSSFNRCLNNEPIMTVGNPVCGNGVREGAEVCDCGISEECLDPCCNPTTCQLVKGAQCFSGKCCDDRCQFVPYGTTCRSAVGDCGITEYCSGQVGTCPQDLHQQNGQACNSGQSYCLEGQCPSHQQQCQYHFGSSSGVSHEQCFIRLNVVGVRYGNCGHSTTKFLPCSKSDVLCGQLQCLGSTRNFINHFNVAVLLQRVSFGTVTCTSFTTPLSSDMMSLGLTQDGTKCGKDQFCMEQRCVAVSQSACPTGSSSLTCSGNGQCNNLNQCSCNIGFSGDSCSDIVPEDQM